MFIVICYYLQRKNNYVINLKQKLYIFLTLLVVLDIMLLFKNKDFGTLILLIKKGDLIMKKLIKKDQKGFTLVEVIVVLVILAIMAAVLIPSLIGYIDKSRQNTVVSETRSIVTAVQTLASEKYAKQNDSSTTVYTLGTVVGTTVILYNDIETLCEIEDLDTKLSGVTITGGKVTALKYSSGGFTCDYPGYIVTPNP